MYQLFDIFMKLLPLRLIQAFTNTFYLRGVPNLLYKFRVFFKKKSNTYDLLKGYRLRLNLDDYFENTALWGYYETPVLGVLNKVLKKGDYYVDVGCNKGLIAVEAASLIGETGQVICFEANPQLKDTIDHNFLINNFNHYTLINKPLSDKESLVRFAVGEQDAFSKIVSADQKNSFVIKEHLELTTITFDEYILGNKLGSEKISTIKIDAEGHDINVVMGMQNYLHDNQATIIFEYSCDQIEQVSALEAIVNKLSYDIFLIKSGIINKIFTKRKFFLEAITFQDLKNVSYSDVLMVSKNNQEHRNALTIH